jgi:Icc protein
VTLSVGVPTVTVYAVEDDAVQLTWSALPGPGTLGVGPVGVKVDGGPPAWVQHRRRSRRLSELAGGPGACSLGGLAPGTTYPVWWEPRRGPRRSIGQVTTLRPPPGRLLARFATISDLHVGERRFGVAYHLYDVHPPSAGSAPYPERAAAAALDEAAAWGATTVVVKGDLSAGGQPPQLRRVAAILADCPLDPLVQLGNHDVVAPLDVGAVLAPLPVAERGVPVVVDLPGVRLVLGDTPSPDDRWGHLDDRQIERLAAAAAGAPGPVALCLHHPPERWPVPTSYPPGLVHSDSRRLLRALSEANPATVILAGHTHRNRTYRMSGLPVAEVGSTKDYPGGWAGYAVHEGGIRQVVRRTAAPEVIRWTETTRRALGGVWGRWSPGTLADRCWTLSWSAR